MQHPLEYFLYRSKLAPGTDAACVARIIKTARQFNAEADITGMLVFDGENFFQYLEGVPHQLYPLIEAIAQDTRHVGFTPLERSPCARGRRYGGWSMAYLQLDDASGLAELAELTPTSALGKMAQLATLVDAH